MLEASQTRSFEILCYLLRPDAQALAAGCCYQPKFERTGAGGAIVMTGPHLPPVGLCPDKSDRAVTLCRPWAQLHFASSISFLLNLSSDSSTEILPSIPRLMVSTWAWRIAKWF